MQSAELGQEFDERTDRIHRLQLYSCDKSSVYPQDVCFMV